MNLLSLGERTFRVPALRAALLSVVVSMSVSTASSAVAPVCDGVHVVQRGGSLVVSPTGADDTANLQCVLDMAIAAGHGAIEFTEGIFHTNTLRAIGFNGTIRGAGMGKTILENMPGMPVFFQDFFTEPPSATRPWPALITFLDGDFSVSDFAIHVVGSKPTTGWTIFGLPTIYSLGYGMIVDDEHANARFARVSVQGEHSDDWLYGVNAYNGIYFESFLGTSTVPLSGSFKVRDSHFTTVASGTSVAVVVDTHISILNNVYTDVVDAFDAADLRGSTAEFIGNTIAGATLAGVYLYDTGTFPDGSSNSHLVIAQNKFSGAAGLFLDLTMTDVGCVLVMNDTKAVTGDGTYLCARTNNCIVISRDPRVVDLGTNNRIITTDH